LTRGAAALGADNFQGKAYRISEIIISFFDDQSSNIVPDLEAELGSIDLRFGERMCPGRGLSAIEWHSDPQPQFRVKDSIDTTLVTENEC